MNVYKTMSFRGGHLWPLGLPCQISMHSGQWFTRRCFAIYKYVPL